MTPYASPKAALAAAAHLARHLDVHSQLGRAQRSPDDPQERPLWVREALRAAGIDPDGELARLLYGWATDELAVLEDSELAEQLTAGLDQLRHELEVRGVVVRHPPLRRMRIGWRVLELVDETRRVLIVTDPDSTDPTIYGTPEAAAAVARRDVDGPVQREIASTPPPPAEHHPELKNEWLARWTAQEFASPLALDEALAADQRWSTRWAREVRTSWGLVLRRGRPKADKRPLCEDGDGQPKMEPIISEARG